MNLVVAFLITATITAIAVGTMLLVRRRAPAGSYFNDGDRAAGVFGVLASGFAILLGFIVFLAFTSYDSARAGAEAESIAIAQQLETAQLFDAATASELTGELACYARYVVGTEWDEMEDGTIGDAPNPWAVAMFRTVQGIDPQTPVHEAAYAKWLDQLSEREVARHDRVHGAAGIIPSPLWIVLLLIAFVIFGYTLIFADSAERAWVQAMLMGSVVAVIVMLLLLLQFLDNPFRRGVGTLKPVAMERTVRFADRVDGIVGHDEPWPCNEVGNAR
jgi:Protein of unknown function (DUF4239)